MSPVSPSLLHRPLPLSVRSLSSLSSAVTVPTFDRSALTPAIVHIGVGGFHRAHQAVYLDDLAELGVQGWGEVGVGLRSPVMRDALAPQDCLFTVVERSSAGDEARVIGTMTQYLYGPDRPAAVLDVLTDPRTRVVTLTVTGDAYNLDTAGVFPRDEHAVREELGRARVPSTVLGYLVEALDRRRRAGMPAFTVLSCDNIPDNGRAARAAVVGFARRRDPHLAAWIDRNATFPSSLVDRITPETRPGAQALVAERFGVRDRRPVFSEPFRQWVVEDEFCNGRPPLADVGVEMVADVAPYALVKKRLLNGGHSALAYLGHLAGHRTTSDVMADQVMAGYLDVLLRDEIAPLLPGVPGLNVVEYQRSVLERFANTRISDDVERLCRRGSTKMPAYLLPSLVEARLRGQPADLLLLAVAGWFRYLRGRGLDGAHIEVADPRKNLLQGLARAGGGDPRPLLGVRALFGSLGDDPVVVAGLERALNLIERHGIVPTVRRYLAAASGTTHA